MKKFMFVVVACLVAAPTLLAQKQAATDTSKSTQQADSAKFSVDARRAARQNAKRDALIVFGQEDTIPQLVVGGEWTAVLTIANFGIDPITDGFGFFIDDQGNQLNLRGSGDLSFTSTGFPFILQPGEVMKIVLESVGPDTQFGSIFMPQPDSCFETNCRMYAEITLRNRNSTRPDFESVFPLEEGFASQSLLFDHRDGFSTLLYVVNTSLQDVTLDLQFYDDFANPLDRVNDIVMNREGSALLTLHVLSPVTLGHYGSVTVSSSNPNQRIVVTALRINPSNSFTPKRAVVVQNPIF